ncbi:condensation domain-containing protein [Streptomyces lavendulae]|uniref:Linear gramicidin synthase subunit D n=1 Tax=Streptomyces lavendulae subsp. lavendulae TaxID=58340 RepID=A0A2K8PB35_STRLA|nr:condensation domain-containing protein [Streptomyces lavendulae]ATZ23951.1 Linear gramicidin synthase subunit D [Streptomyces lavendulae subsp. lavendulae]QUQ53782.1 Linear gramicidin synthase subunit D [Streptomyces lavendulae subsp. lavendulae]
MTAVRQLSAAQRSLWTAYRMAPDGSAYNMILPLRVRGPLDTALLGRAVEEVARRHEVLRSLFDEIDGVPVRLPQDVPPARLEVVEVPGASEEELRRLAREAGRRAFVLESGGPLRIVLYRRTPEDFVLSTAAHHIAGDFTSYWLLLSELFTFYRSLVTGEEPDLAPPGRTYEEYVAEEAAHPSTPAGQRDLAYWSGVLDGAIATELPTDRPRPAVPRHRGGTVELDLAPLSDDLQRAAKSAGLRPFPLLVAAYQAVIAGWTGESEVVIGTPASTRTRSDRGVFGCYLNTIPVRTRPGPGTTFASLAAETGRQLLQGMRHSRLPSVEARQRGRGPLVRMGALLLQMDGLDAQFPQPAPGRYEGEPARFCGLSVSRLAEPNQEGQLDLMLTLHQGVHGLTGVLTYDGDLFEHETVERFARCYERFLRAAADDPGRETREVPMTDEDELATLLALGGG